MKFWLFLSLGFLSLGANADFIGPEIFHKAESVAKIRIDSLKIRPAILNGKAEVLINYDVIVPWYLNLPGLDFSGEKSIHYDESLFYERGFFELQKKKTIELKKYIITYIDEKKCGQNICHLFKIERKDKSWLVQALYDPQVPGIGWRKTNMVISKFSSLIGLIETSTQYQEN